MKSLLIQTFVPLAIALSSVVAASADDQETPRPGSDPRFDTPFGYFVEASRSHRPEVKTYFIARLVLGGSLTVGSADAPVTVHKVKDSQQLLLIRFWNPKEADQFIDRDDVRIVADGKEYKSIAHAGDPTREYYQVSGGILSGNMKAGKGNQYWMFIVPRMAKLIAFQFKGDALPLDASKIGDNIQYRTWTSNDDRKIEAAFLSFREGNVLLKRKADGKIYAVPLERLCDADQKLLKPDFED